MNSLFSGTLYKKSVNSHITTWESWLLRLGWTIHFEEGSTNKSQPTKQYVYKNDDLSIKIQN